MNKKEQRQAERAIKKTALKEGITETEFRNELEKAIEIGWNNENIQIKRYWQKVAKGQKPTPEEFILFVSNEAKKKKGSINNARGGFI